MEVGFIALGILSILYYVCLAWHTKKLNSTFAWFWIAYGLWNILLGCFVKIAPNWVDYVVLGICAAVAILFLVVQILILCAMVVLPKSKLKYIIILGAQIRGRKLTGSLKRRLDRGLRYLQENPETLCIVSGGRGKGEDISEAEAMADYLRSCGIDDSRIRLEDESTTTWENLSFSRSFIENEEKDKVGIISNNFHIYRAMKMARILGYKKVFAIPATTDLVVFPNYMVREFFALFVMIKEIRDSRNV